MLISNLCLYSIGLTMIFNFVSARSQFIYIATARLGSSGCVLRSQTLNVINRMYAKRDEKTSNGTVPATSSLHTPRSSRTSTPLATTLHCLQSHAYLHYLQVHSTAYNPTHPHPHHLQLHSTAHTLTHDHTARNYTVIVTRAHTNIYTLTTRTQIYTACVYTAAD